MEKPITVTVQETRDAIATILNESNLHPILMEKIVSDIHSEVVGILNQVTQKEKMEYEESLNNEEQAME